MRLWLDTFNQMVRTLWAHKLRSFLPMFGIAWGVGSLLLLVGLGEGFRTGNHKQLSTLGKDVLFMFPGQVPAVPGQHTSQRPYFLTYGDYLAVKAESPAVRAVTPILSRNDLRAQSEFATSNGNVIGVQPEFGDIRSIPIAQGRWINDLDVQQARNVAVIGTEMRRNLFHGQPAVGSH